MFVEFRYQGYPAGQHSFAATTYVDALYSIGENIFELELFIQFSDGAFTLPSDDAVSIDAADAKPAEIASIAPTNRINNILFIARFLLWFYPPPNISVAFVFFPRSHLPPPGRAINCFTPSRNGIFGAI